MKVVHAGVYREWEELDALMKNFSVARGVVDAMPELRNARAFAERHKGKVFINFYNDKQRGGYAWNEKDLTVSSNRTESLDANRDVIRHGRVVFPRRTEIMETVAAHCHNMAKKLEEDEETGSKHYVYVRLGPDHFRHAFNYLVMAMKRGASGLFFGCDFTS